TSPSQVESVEASSTITSSNGPSGSTATVTRRQSSWSTGASLWTGMTIDSNGSSVIVLMLAVGLAAVGRAQPVPELEPAHARRADDLAVPAKRHARIARSGHLLETLHRARPENGALGEPGDDEEGGDGCHERDSPRHPRGNPAPQP